MPPPKKKPARSQRRSSEEILAGLQEEIRRVRTRAARTAAEAPSDALKAAIRAVRAIDDALAAAAAERDAVLRRALADARRSLAAQLSKRGVPVAKVALPRGPRPRELG